MCPSDDRTAVRRRRPTGDDDDTRNQNRFAVEIRRAIKHAVGRRPKGSACHNLLANERAGLAGNVRVGGCIKGRLPQCWEGGAGRKTDGREQSCDGPPAETKSHFDAMAAHHSHSVEDLYFASGTVALGGDPPDPSAFDKRPDS